MNEILLLIMQQLLIPLILALLVFSFPPSTSVFSCSLTRTTFYHGILGMTSCSNRGNFSINGCILRRFAGFGALFCVLGARMILWRRRYFIKSSTAYPI